MAASGDHEEEKVLCEIPVFLSKGLSKNLYLAQYPQRPATVPIKDSEVLGAKIKPGLNKIQMTLGVDTESEYYDECHGERLAEAAEGLGLTDDEYIPDTRKKIDKTVLESTCHPKLTKPSRYVVGVVKQGAVYLTPLNSVVQMKPTLPFLNKADNAREKHESGDVIVKVEAGEDEAQKVTVKFERNPIDPNKPTFAARSSLTARKKEEGERWVDLKYESSNEKVSSELCTENIDNDVPMYVLTQKDYLAKLFPKHVEPVIDGSDKDVHQIINVEKMKDVPLAEQLKILILNGKVMRHDQVVEFLRTRLRISVDEADILITLQTVAVLVQGVWVAKSELLYPEDFKSNANGVAGPIMQAARDTVLSMFNDRRFVEKPKLLPILHLPDEELTEILFSISKRRVNKGWEFMLPYDHTFIDRFPDVVRRQYMVWKKKDQYKNRKVSKDKGESSLKPPTSLPPPQRQESSTMSQSSDSGSGAEVEKGRGRGCRGARGAAGRQRRPSSRSGAGPKSSGVAPKVEKKATK